MALKPKSLILAALILAPALGLALSVAGQWQSHGNDLYKKGDTAGAIEAWKKSLAADPSNAALAEFLKKLEPASQPSTSSHDNADWEEKYDEAKTMLAEHQFSDAAESLKKLIAASPGHAGAYAALGDAYYGLGLARAARSAYLKSLALDREQPRVSSFVADHLPPDVQDAAGEGGSVNRFAPLWRSMLIPGWGQVYNKQGDKGLLLGLGTLALLGGAAGTYMAADASYKDYSALGPGTSESDFNSAYDRVQTMATYNHVLTVLFYAAYIYNVGDAAVNARAESGVSARLQLSPQGTPQLALNKIF